MKRRFVSALAAFAAALALVLGATGGAGAAVAVPVDAPSVIIDPPTLRSATVGAAYLQVLTASGGVGPYTYAVTSGSLPAGLTLTSRGVISGTPTAWGSFTFEVTVTGSAWETGSRSFSFSVAPPMLDISPAFLSDMRLGAVISAQLTVSGGTPPYTFQLAGGSLPAGLTLSATGVIDGTPATPGRYNFTVQATDSSTGTRPFASSRSYSVTVAAPTISITPEMLDVAKAGVPYTATVTATGGVAPYLFAVTAGALPPGLALDASGTISGTPTAAGEFPVTVTTTDSSRFSAARTYRFVVGAPTLSVTASQSVAPLRMTVGSPVSVTFTGSGGNGPWIYAIDSGSLPAGLSLTPSGVLAGIPTAPATGDVVISATDGTSGSGAPYRVRVPVSFTVSPVVASLAPNSAVPGETVVVTGAGFTGTRTVTIGGDPAAFTVESDSRLTAVVPTGASSGASTLVVTPAVDASTAASAPLTILAPLAVTSAPGLAADKGLPFSHAFSATGGTGPYTFAVAPGAALPAGLLLAADGTLSGTPTAGGASTFEVVVTDASARTATAPVTVRVYGSALAAPSGAVVAGGTLDVTGSDFSPGAYDVVLHSDPVTLGTVTVTGDGELTGAFTLPADVQPGAHELQIVRDGVVYARQPVEIAPAPVAESPAPTVSGAPSPSPSTSSTAAALPSTGGTLSPWPVVAGALLVLAGLGAVLGVRRRTSRAD